MRDYLKLLLFIAVMFGLLSSGWVSWSAQNVCPDKEMQQGMDENRFLSAHGISKDNYSVWLKEHSVWRKTYSIELEQYSFIPPKPDNGSK